MSLIGTCCRSTAFRILDLSKRRSGAGSNLGLVRKLFFCSTPVVQKNGNNESSSDLSTTRTLEAYGRLIPDAEYRDRHSKLVHLVARSRENKPCLLLVPAAFKTYQADTQIPLIHFKQNSEFIYLTGLNTSTAANCVLAICGLDGESYSSILFVPMPTQTELLWEGPGIMSQDSLDRLRAIFDHISDIKDLDTLVNEHSSKSVETFVARCGLKGRKSTVVAGKVQEPQQLSPFIDQLRLIKSHNELLAMKRACSIGGQAMSSTMEWTRSKTSGQNVINESQIGAKFEYESRINGAIKLAFPSVVAGAHRSTIIHYGSNDQAIGHDDWLLMDAGCEDIEGYNSDITRTWPLAGHDAGVNVSRDKLREALHQALIEVHLELIASLRDDRVSTTLDNMFTLMCHLLGKVLIEFNVIPKSTSAKESARMAYKFCPHHVSHYLGLDVHDTPSISRNIPLVPGMVFTVEPGLYFRPQDENVKKEFKGIGLRIEDDLCIELNGSHKLTVLTE